MKTRLHLVLWIIGGLALLLLVFGFGTIVGYRAAAFRMNSGEHYFADFGFGAPFTAKPFGPLFVFRGPNPHGAVGKVVDVGTSTLAIVDPDNDESSIVIGPATAIEENGSAISISGIHPGDVIAVIGAPNGSGQVEARFVRVFPPAATTATPAAAR